MLKTLRLYSLDGLLKRPRPSPTHAKYAHVYGQPSGAQRGADRSRRSLQVLVVGQGTRQTLFIASRNLLESSTPVNIPLLQFSADISSRGPFPYSPWVRLPPLTLLFKRKLHLLKIQPLITPNSNRLKQQMNVRRWILLAKVVVLRVVWQLVIPVLAAPEFVTKVRCDYSFQFYLGNVPT